MDYLSESHIHPDIARGRRMASPGPALKPKRRYLTRDLLFACAALLLTIFVAGAVLDHVLSNARTIPSEGTP